jgi:ABC-type transport system substrate-binding protein
MGVDRAGRMRGSRRWFLGVTGAAAGAAGLAAIGCGGESKPVRVDLPTATQPPTVRPSPTSPGTPPTPADPSLRITGFVVGDGQFDPHKTQVGTLHGQQGFVYSRLIAYDNQALGNLSPDLAVAMPEQPDALTYIFRLNRAGRWHGVAPLNGRPVTAEDVVYSIQRQAQGDPSFVRKARWVDIESIEATSEDTVVIKSKTPLAPLMSRFADANAYIVAPEQDQPDYRFSKERQYGSGPYQWVEWDEGKFASVSRNAGWFKAAPRLSGITIAQFNNARDVEAELRVKDLDAAFVGREQADSLKADLPGLLESQVGNALFFGMRFFMPAKPFDDERFRSAISVGVDRRDLVQRFFQGSGEANPWVSWPVTQWTLPQDTLSTVPGYRLGSGGREKDIGDAQLLLRAYGEDNEIQKELTLHVEATAEETLGLGARIREHLLPLGLTVTVQPLPIGELVAQHFAGQAPWIAGPDTGWIDLDDWVYPYFHSEGTQNSFALRDEELDGLIVGQRGEMDAAARQKAGHDIQRRLLKINAGVNLVSERIVALRWPYVRNFPLDITDGYQHRFAGCWIDQTDPSYPVS